MESKVDFQNQNACNRLLLDKSRPNPFPGRPCAADFIKNPPQFVLGRNDDRDRIKAIIDSAVAGDKAQLVRVFASQGIGKSALISWVLQKQIEDLGTEKMVVVNLEITDSLEDFQVLTLYKQLISQYHQNGSLKQLAFKSMSKALSLAWNKGGKLQQAILDKFSGDVRERIMKDPAILDKYLAENREVLENLITLVKNNFFLLESDIPVNFQFLITLWTAYSGLADWSNARAALEGSGRFTTIEVKNSNTALDQIKSLNAFRNWIYPDYATIILIDHMERIGKNEPKYSSLFTTLNTFRNIPHFCFILSGTLDAFSEMDEIVGGDKIAQIHNWEHAIDLHHLPNNIVGDIVAKHLDIFWAKTNERPPTHYQLYPFSPNSVSYLYDTNQKDLRKTLIHLNDLIESYRNSAKIVHVKDIFMAMRFLRTNKDYLLTPFEQTHLVGRLMDPKIQDLSRSKALEKKICEFLDIMTYDEHFNYLHNIQHEPAIGPKGEKPDVYFEFFGKDSVQKLRKVAIEVKLYRVGSKIPPEQIQKTHVLLEAKVIDHVSWLSNKPLSIAGRALPTEFEPHLGRVQPLTEYELAYAGLILYYEDIFGAAPTPDIANEILKKAGIDVEVIASAVKDIEPLVPVPPPLPVKKQASKRSRGAVKRVSTLELTDADLQSRLGPVLDSLSRQGREHLQPNGISSLLLKIDSEIPVGNTTEKDRVWGILCGYARSSNFRVTGSRIYFK